MIHVEATIKYKGYNPLYLSPSSTKRICAICDECGRVRYVMKFSYRDLCVSCAAKKSHRSPESRQRMSDLKKEHYKNPKNLETSSVAGLKYNKEHPEKGRKHAAIMKERFKDQTIVETAIKANNKRWEDPLEREKQSMAMKLAHINDPTLAQRNGDAIHRAYLNDPTLNERSSASHQGQDYGVGEWGGYTDKSRPHLVPIDQCMHINERFVGSEGHHILKNVVAFIPKELHQHTRHNIKNGQGMDKINLLSLQYIRSE